jgi:hypothetical protein
MKMKAKWRNEMAKISMAISSAKSMAKNEML